jgi:hypothetical protein
MGIFAAVSVIIVIHAYTTQNIINMHVIMSCIFGIAGRLLMMLRWLELLLNFL